MDSKTTFKHWYAVVRFTNFQLQEFSRPSFVGKKKVPDDLNHLTIGQLMRLGMAAETDEIIYKVCEIILDLDRETVDKSRATDVVRFAGWVMSEIRRINKLFDSTNVKPTQQQVRAGISNLQFGMFGILDWYARRMGYREHEKVGDVPWINIYKCMDMDAKTTLYERKLQEVLSNDNRAKSKRHR